MTSFGLPKLSSSPGRFGLRDAEIGGPIATDFAIPAPWLRYEGAVARKGRSIFGPFDSRPDAPPGRDREFLAMRSPTRNDRGHRVAILDPSDDASGLIAAMLADQDDLSAVERFAQFHDETDVHVQGAYYRSLLPASSPGPGQQLGFEVDLDRCTGCKACVAGCHSLNGLDDDESWRDVGLLVARGDGLSILQHVTSACHHCLEPACLNACPVDAYEKDPITGIVRHLDDQCFGCQYCTLACPYDVPKFHAGKGIVRKCDMCSSRLSAGEAPACVQACPTEAIRIRVVDRAEIAERGAAGVFLPSAPDPGFTLPTTRYLSARPLSLDFHAAGVPRDEPEHVPMSLVMMLVLTQASVGTFLVDLFTRGSGVAGGGMTIALLVMAITFGLAGLSASLFHLGRPLYAFRAVIGWRHSWLSREVIAFGGFAFLAKIHAGLGLWSWIGGPRLSSSLSLALSAVVVAAGAAGVGCSVMVYHATRRAFWNASISLRKFAGTTFLLGGEAWLVASWIGDRPGQQWLAAGLVVLASCLKIRFEREDVHTDDDVEDSAADRTARLLRGRLRGAWQTRAGLLYVGGLALPVITLGMTTPMIPLVGQGAAVIALVFAMAGEVVERGLFFAAVVKPKMPGGLAR